MQKMREELNANVVGANSVRPHFEGMTLNHQKGITLIALIITIIVMLILVGVTINVALNGGLFSKAEEAGAKTKIAQIQEALTIKKAEVLAEENGKEPADYGITMDKLDLPAQLKTEYENKLIISKDGILYYDESVVTDATEQNTFKSMGIQPYVETPEPNPGRVPFANYIENGNNYYISGDKNSSSYKVAVFSKNSSDVIIYTIENGKKGENTKDGHIDRIIDKEKVESELGYSNELLAQAMQTSFQDISDDVFFSLESSALILFKSNYSIANIMNEFYTLDTTYTLPTE